MRRPHDRLPPCGARNRAHTPCQLPAGWGTDHPGQGKCRLHGGQARIKHGRYSRIIRPSVKSRPDALHAADPDPLDLLPEVQLLRALTIDFIERYDVALEALLAWHAAGHPEGSRPRQILDIADAGRLLERIGRIVEIIHKTQQEQTISLDTFRRLMEQMALTVARYVSDGDTLRAIEQAWGEIRVDAGRVSGR